MPGNEIRTSQFGLVGGIRQSLSELILVAEPGGSFAPELRKGRLYIVTETDQNSPKGREACQFVAQTAYKAFYDDTSLSITASLRAAIRVANKALYGQNFSVDSSRRAYVGLTCAVVKDHDLFIGQIAPTQAYVLAEGNLRAMPMHPSWKSAHTSTTPFLKPNALGASLFVEPEFYRCRLSRGDMLALCSSNVAPLLRREELAPILQQQEPVVATEQLHTFCRQHGLAEAHVLVVELLPVSGTVGRSAALLPLSLRERSTLALRTVGDWVAGLASTPGTPKRRSSEPQPGEASEATDNHAPARPDPLTTLPEQPYYPPNPLPQPQPIELGENLEERYEREQAARHELAQLPPSTFLGENMLTEKSMLTQRRIDLSDTRALVARSRPYRPRRELRPLVDMTLGERLLLPFQQISNAVEDAFARTRRRRLQPSPVPVPRGQGLSYRRHHPPFPWIPLFVLGLLVTLLILYGTNLSRRSAQQSVQEDMDMASQAMATVYAATDNTTALEELEKAHQQIENVRSNPLVTETNTLLWTGYQELERDYERAQAQLQRMSFFENSEILAEHPYMLTKDDPGLGGRFSSIIIPPATTVSTDTNALEAIRYIYALDNDENKSQLYRIPRSGGTPEPYLGMGTEVQRTVVGPIYAQSWRVDNIVAVDQGPNGFGYYFRNGGEWNYTRLGGSEIWAPGNARLDLETYEGNLYVWGAEAGEILKYESGRYGDPPVLWIDPAGLGEYDITTAVDMAVDGNIYLLQPDGHILSLNGGRIEREIVPESITPAINVATRIFVTGTPVDGSFFLLEPFNERIIQVEKTTGRVIQQMRMRANSPVQLTHLVDLFVDASGIRPVLYIVNGGQIIRVELPDPPNPFRQSEATPAAEPPPPAPAP